MKKLILAALGFIFLFTTQTLSAQKCDSTLSAEKQKQLLELSSKLNPGKHLEEKKDGNSMVYTCIIVTNKNTCATEYTKRVYTWGGVYYFRNDLSISQAEYLEATRDN